MWLLILTGGCELRVVVNCELRVVAGTTRVRLVHVLMSRPGKKKSIALSVKFTCIIVRQTLAYFDVNTFRAKCILALRRCSTAFLCFFFQLTKDLKIAQNQYVY